ncbi:hypothetical protein Y1Q_0019064 [Alligator mississippiensis]|uniref:Uncharacterized protein n=1 Tax=Alligator mississippiensis TaxID=8496 RepID=A0A151N118_ALLMI|nr:hypothetical protein Y1Q_0019064 [Alligator mississippiensis]
MEPQRINLHSAQSHQEEEAAPSEERHNSISLISKLYGAAACPCREHLGLHGKWRTPRFNERGWKKWDCEAAKGHT